MIVIQEKHNLFFDCKQLDIITIFLVSLAFLTSFMRNHILALLLCFGGSVLITVMYASMLLGQDCSSDSPES